MNLSAELQADIYAQRIKALEVRRESALRRGLMVTEIDEALDRLKEQADEYAARTTG